jgi:hypothetical protein
MLKPLWYGPSGSTPQSATEGALLRIGLILSVVPSDRRPPGRKVNLSHVFAGQNVGVTKVGERIWLVTFMRYDLGYFDDETCRLEPIENPFGPKVLPIRSE